MDLDQEDGADIDLLAGGELQAGGRDIDEGNLGRACLGVRSRLHSALGRRSFGRPLLILANELRLEEQPGRTRSARSIRTLLFHDLFPVFVLKTYGDLYHTNVHPGVNMWGSAEMPDESGAL